MLNTKIACVLAPALPIQVEKLKGGPSMPLIVTHPVEDTVVFAVSEEVAKGGVVAGMSLYQARQMSPGARVVEADEVAYHARHSAIEVALREFSPVIETVELGEFVVDARGLEKSHPNDQAIAEAMQVAVHAASGLSIQVGLATGKFTAQHAARLALPGNIQVIAPGDEARFLASLPVSILPNLPGEVLRRLHLLDLYTLGDLAALSKPAVMRQFGGAISGLYELARGHDPRPLSPDVPPLRLFKSMRLNSPVRERTILVNVITRLARQLSHTLDHKGYHAEAIKLTLLGESGQRWEIGQAAKPPTSDTTRLCRLAAQMLGRLSLTAPVERVIVSAYPLRSWHLTAHQMTLADAGVSVKQRRLEETIQLLVHRFSDTVIRIAALLGPPLPVKIRVGLNSQGHPDRLFYGGANRVVTGIDESWREEKFWWDRPIKRDYFRVMLGDGSLRNIFQDLLTDSWFLDRAWPLL